MTTLDDVLAQCLNDVQSGRATVQECLERHPDYARQLRPLLLTAVAVQGTPAVEPSPIFQQTAKTRLLNLIAARDARGTAPALRPASRVPRRWAAVWARVLVVVLTLSVLCAGTAFASRDSLPDSPLYPVKVTLEQVRLVATPDQVHKTRLFLDLLDRRAMETAAMARNGKLVLANRTGQDYARLLRDAEAVTDRLPSDRSEWRLLLLVMRDHLNKHQSVFQRALAEAPAHTRPPLQRSLSLTNEAIQRINRRLSGQSAPTIAPAPSRMAPPAQRRQAT